VHAVAERALRAVGSPQPQVDARILAAAIDGLRLEEVTAPRTGVERRVRPVIERLLNGLCAPPGPQPPSRGASG
jgi:hypothetical protein